MENPGVFAALADPTRRLLVEWLSAEESGTATGFADRLPISRQAVARHLQELEQAGLVRSKRVGRETRFSLETEPLTEAAGWLERRTEVWVSTLGRLKRHLETEGSGDAP